jgi:hypothetical protein
MTIQPAGNPLWYRNAGITQYGGDLNKKDYGGIGSINAMTDLSAAQFCRLTADMAAVARLCPLMRLVFTTSAGSPATAVNWCAPAWAIALAYADGSAPPSASYPTITGSSTSRTVTLSATATDDYGVTVAIYPKIVRATGGVWDGVITSNAFTITGLTNGAPAVVTIW